MSRFGSCCIIDDDEFFAYNTTKLMKEIGFCENILWYLDGQEAIDTLVGLLVENIPLPDIILLDLNMPNKNGWEFLKEFENIPLLQRKNVKIYVVSSFISPENIAKAKSFSSVESFLIKPITAASLDSIK